MNTDWKNIDEANLKHLTLGEAEKLFGLEHDFTEEDLKRVRNALSRQYHPDLNPDSGNIMSKINTVYDILKNEIKNRRVRNAEQNNANGGATDTTNTTSDSTKEEPETENLNNDAGATDSTDTSSDSTREEPEAENLNNNAGATDTTNTTSDSTKEEPEAENLNNNAGAADTTNTSSDSTQEEPEVENLNDNATNNSASSKENKEENNYTEGKSKEGNNNLTWEKINAEGFNNLTLDDALSLFNLENNFTERELYDAYNSLDRRYNPMNYRIGSEEAEKSRTTMNSIYGVYTILRQNLVIRQNAQASASRSNGSNERTQASAEHTNTTKNEANQQKDKEEENSQNKNKETSSQTSPEGPNADNNNHKQPNKPEEPSRDNDKKPNNTTIPTGGDLVVYNDNTKDPEPIPVIKSTPVKIKSHRKQILIIVGIIALAISVTQAVNFSIVARMAANGQLWHVTSSVAKQAALHMQNINLANKLIALKSSYESLSGIWTIAGQQLLTGHLQTILQGISIGSGVLGVSCLANGLIKKKSEAYKNYKNNIRQLVKDFNELDNDEANKQLNDLREKINNSKDLSDGERRSLLNQLKKAEKINSQYEDLEQGEELEGGMSL